MLKYVEIGSNQLYDQTLKKSFYTKTEQFNFKSIFLPVTVKHQNYFAHRKE